MKSSSLSGLRKAAAAILVIGLTVTGVQASSLTPEQRGFEIAARSPTPLNCPQDDAKDESFALKAQRLLTVFFRAWVNVPRMGKWLRLEFVKQTERFVLDVRCNGSSCFLHACHVAQ